MLLLLLALLVPFATGVLLTLVLWPLQGSPARGLLMRLSLAVVIGLGLAACVVLVIMTCQGPVRGTIIIVDLALAMAAAFAYVLLLLRQRGQEPPEQPNPPAKGRFALLLLIGLIVILAGAVWVFSLLSVTKPHGGWDAWAFWNLRAKHLVERDESEWRLAFSPGVVSHPDYPPLLPLTVARLWKWTGSESVTAPILVSGLFTFATVGVIVAGLRLICTPAKGYVAGIVLLGTPFFVSDGAAQYADTVIGCYFLTTIVLMTLHETQEQRYPGLLTLAGITCGLAAFTKNEGLLFLPVALGVWSWIHLIRGKRDGRLRKLAAFASGLIPVLVLVAFFKTQIAPDTSQMSAMSAGDLFSKILSPSRYIRIAGAFLSELFADGHWSVFPFVVPLYLLVVGIDIPKPGRRAAKTAAGILLFMLVGYFAFYVMTPFDLTWHLRTSLLRLFLQLWPTALFVCFLVARSPDKAAADINISA